MVLLVSTASSTPLASGRQSGAEAQRAIHANAEHASRFAGEYKPADADVRLADAMLVARAQSTYAPERPTFVPVRFAAIAPERPVVPGRFDAEIAAERALGLSEPGVGSALLSTLALVLFAFLRRLRR